MKVLREVAARGSFSAAAESLSFTQSAISQQVAALERETGATLLERGCARRAPHRRGPRPGVRTPTRSSARIDDAEEELAALAGLRGGRLRLACFQSAGATLVPRAVAAFHERHPEVELSMVEAEPDEAKERLRSGEIDLALVYDFEPVPGAWLRSLELFQLIDDQLRSRAARRTTRWPGGRACRLADLADEPWISSGRSYGCRAIAERACQRRRIRAEGGVRGRRDDGRAGARGRGRRASRSSRGWRCIPCIRAWWPVARQRRPRAPDLGRPPGRGLPLAGQRGDGADPVDVAEEFRQSEPLAAVS